MVEILGGLSPNQRFWLVIRFALIINYFRN